MAENLRDAKDGLLASLESEATAQTKLTLSKEKQVLLLECARSALIAGDEAKAREFLEARESEKRASILAEAEIGLAAQRVTKAAGFVKFLESRYAEMEKTITIAGAGADGTPEDPLLRRFRNLDRS